MKINKKIEVQNLNELFDITCSNRTEYSSCWLNVSINNYNTAFVLFKNNIYCHAIFFMQQSIECLIKAILIENNLISLVILKVQIIVLNKLWMNISLTKNRKRTILFYSLRIKFIMKVILRRNFN